jgi:hypothetical protein
MESFVTGFCHLTLLLPATNCFVLLWWMSNQGQVLLCVIGKYSYHWATTIALRQQSVTTCVQCCLWWNTLEIQWQQLFILLYFEAGFHYIAQAQLVILLSPPSSVGIIGMPHHTQLWQKILLGTIYAGTLCLAHTNFPRRNLMFTLK